MANRYWVGGSGNWSDTAHWSTTSGGAGGASVPGSGDTANISASSIERVINLVGDITVVDLWIDVGIFFGTPERLVFNSNNYTINGDVYLNRSFGNSNNESKINLGSTTINGSFSTYNQYSSGLLPISAIDASNASIIGRISVSPSQDYLPVLYNKTTGLLRGRILVRRLVGIDYPVIFNSTTMVGNSIVAFSGASGEGSITGSSKYYAGASSTVTGTGWIKQDAPKIADMKEDFDTLDKWDVTKNSATVTADGSLTINAVGSSGYAYIRSKDQYLLDGSSIRFDIDRTSMGENGVGGFYLTSAFNQYGVTARKNIPDISLIFNNNSATLSIVGGSAYSQTISLTDEVFFQFSLNNGVLSFDTASNTGSYINRSSITLSDYDIDATQLAAQPTFSWESSGSGSYSVSGINTSFVDYISSVTSAFIPFTAKFTNTSTYAATSWSWDFGDGGTSTAKSPTHTYSTQGSYTVSLTGTGSDGSQTITKNNYIIAQLKQYSFSITSTNTDTSSAIVLSETALLSILSTDKDSSKLTILTNFQQLSEPEYEYRVYNPDGSFLGIWTDVTSDFSYSQNINENAGALQVTLGRNSENRSVIYDYLLDVSGDPILDENSQPIIVPTRTRNSVGVGTDVQNDLLVNVYKYYGGYEALLDLNSDPILDQNSDPILVPHGAPNGTQVYCGKIAQWELDYGDTAGVIVSVIPRSTDLSNIMFMNNQGNTVGDVTIAYLNTDPGKIIRDAIDKYIARGGSVYYTPDTVPNTGQSVDYTFKLQTTREVLDVCATGLLSGGYYWYVDQHDNRLYLKNKGDTPDHIFYNEKHLSDLKLVSTITNLVNDVYFLGGDTVQGDDTTVLYKHKIDADSNNKHKGLLKLSDSRVTLDSSAELLAQRQIEEYNRERYQSTIIISDAVYDIESISLGDMVGFRNFDSFVDSTVLQIVGMTRASHSVTISLDTALTGTLKRLETLKRQLESQEAKQLTTKQLTT